jgi:threonine synthase
MEVSAHSVDDATIRKTIGDVWKKHHYIVCPHTATGEYVRTVLGLEVPTVVYATAHPAKFNTIVEPEISTEVPVPLQLAQLLDKDSSSKQIKADYRQLFT